MGMLQRLSRAAEQVNEMAELLGVDAQRRPDPIPEFEAARLRSRIFRCAWCDRHDDCAERLAAGAFTEAPDYCRNKAEFDGLLLQMVENA